MKFMISFWLNKKHEYVKSVETLYLASDGGENITSNVN
jgi:hypothetical protein